MQDILVFNAGFYSTELREDLNIIRCKASILTHSLTEYHDQLIKLVEEPWEEHGEKINLSKNTFRLFGRFNKLHSSYQTMLLSYNKFVNHVVELTTFHSSNIHINDLGKIYKAYGELHTFFTAVGEERQRLIDKTHAMQKFLKRHEDLFIKE